MGFGDLASASAVVNQATRTVSGVVSTAGVAFDSVGRSAADIRSASINGITNVGSGIVSSLPGVAAGVGSAALAVGALGTLTGNNNLARAATNVAGAVGAITAGVAAVSAAASAIGAVASALGFGGGGGGGGAFGGAAGNSNPLHAYASYTYMFRLSALSDGEVNAGARGPYTGVPIIDMPNGPTVGATTYIDNVRIQGVVGLNEKAGNSNALSISFTVIEPYSMGKFWETLQTAAMMAGHQNYAAAPYQLAIRFKGHFDADSLFQTIPNTDKFIHLKILDMQMKVTKRGAEYEINAFPWSEGGMSTSFAEIKTDQKIFCNDGGPYKVKDILKYATSSLKEVINAKLKDDKDRKKTVTNAHEIEICFPPEPYTSNSDGNIIGESDLGLSQFNRADNNFAKEGATYENGIYKRGDLVLDTKNGSYQFPKGATIQDIINQVILSSDYGRKALQNPGPTIKWWRIETHFHNISSEDPKTGEKAKKIIFRVVPYEFDSAKFSAPNTSSAPPPVVRELNWLYTGKNHDILDWNIDYKLGFYKSFNADGGANSEDKNLAQRSSNAAPVRAGGTPPEAEPSGSSGPEKARRDRNQTRTGLFGGASFDDAATNAARQFHDIINNDYDMLNLDLLILGDPYFLGDSGMGNFTIAGSGPANGEGSINWQGGEVHIKLTFRMPEDANTDTGLYDFGGLGKPVREFSGYYKVQGVESTFQKGKFTQRLQLIKKLGVIDPGPVILPPPEPAPEDPGIYYP